MSAGLHRLWKDDLITWLNPPRSQRPFELIDAAAGTGDVALKALRGGGPGCRATLCDINPAMLEVGRDRLRQAGLAARASFAIGNAEALPFADQRFDAFTIAFGIRNVTRIDKALAEARRVLKRGGRFLCLEFSCSMCPCLTGSTIFIPSRSSRGSAPWPPAQPNPIATWSKALAPSPTSAALRA